MLPALQWLIVRNKGATTQMLLREGRACMGAAYVVFRSPAERGAGESERPVMVARGVAKLPEQALGGVGLPAVGGSPQGCAMTMERMPVGIWSPPVRQKSSSPFTCSMPSRNRMKQPSHLHSTDSA